MNKEKRLFVAKVQKKQMAHKLELAAAKQAADRQSDRDWVAYNRKMDAYERHQQQLISKRNRQNALALKKVKWLSGCM